MATLGLDIGGASLKGATSTGWTRAARFALWRNPDGLADELVRLADGASFSSVAVTMTGELCDGFETKEEGVRRILGAVVRALGSCPIRVWQTTGRFASVTEAQATPWETGAANWLAVATYVGRYVPTGTALFIDMGSTTTDVIVLRDGAPTPTGRTDPERLATGELVYQGVRRTPICALLPQATVGGVEYRTMGELFASSLDAYLVLGEIPEDESSSETADQRPETVARAVDRLSRMIGSDRSRFSLANAVELSRQIKAAQAGTVADGIRQVLRDQEIDRPDHLVTSGEGEFFLQALADDVAELKGVSAIRLADRWSAELSRSACAYAVAILAEESL